MNKSRIVGSILAGLAGRMTTRSYEKGGVMTDRDKLILSSLFLVVLMIALPGHAQIDYSTATLRGTVYDRPGGVIPGATVTVTNPDTGVVKTAKTAADGTYQVPALNPGTYRVAVEAQGFAKTLATNVLLTVGQIVVYNAHLEVGSVSTIVEVSTEAPLIETQQTQQADTINQAQV